MESEEDATKTIQNPEEEQADTAIEEELEEEGAAVAESMEVDVAEAATQVVNDSEEQSEEVESDTKVDDKEEGEIESGKENENITPEELTAEGEGEEGEEEEEATIPELNKMVEDDNEMVNEEEEEMGDRPMNNDVEEEEEEDGELEIDEGVDETEDNETIDKTSQDETTQKEIGGSIVTRKRTLSQSSGGEDGPKRKVGRSVAGVTTSSDGTKHDKYCWVCHKDGVQVNCKLCPRSYHTKCMSVDYPTAKIGQGDSSCPCPECVVVMNAETLEFRSDAMKLLTLDQLMGLLKNVCLRMRQTPGSDPFIQPVDPNEAEDYLDYIVYPMDIETLEKNIKKRLYGSTEGFLADAQWLVHNSIVFNSASSQYSQYAKKILKVCKQELAEIETCPECYTNAYDKHEEWFIQACRRPHVLVWAKLKGFPFWPAKAVKIQNTDVDVRFFGQHDRAWVAIKDCFLYSEEMPVAPPKKSGPLLSAIEELNAHVDKLKEVHGPVVFATVKTQIGPQINTEQIRRMLPEYSPPDQPSKAQGTASTVKSNQSANNNNNNTKTPQPPKKSPMTIRISSLKTNPTIVNNSAVSVDETSTEGRVVTRLTRKSSAATQSQSAGLSESEHSTDENQGVDANQVEETKTESVPDNTNGTDDDDESGPPTLPKGSEILANALGGGPLRRSTRGLSRSGDSSHTTEAGTAEKRLTRNSVKGSTADGGNETDESSGQLADEQPPDSVLEAMGLSKKPKEGALSSQRAGQIKSEPAEHFNDADGEAMDTHPPNKSSHTLVGQLSAHTPVKPGYRFNLSKDISISAVDGGSGGNLVEPTDEFEGVNHAASVSANLKIRRANPTVGGAQRGVPQAIPVGVGAIRPRVQSNNPGILNGQQQPRTFTGQQLRQMVRNAKPQHILNPRTGQTIRVAGPAGGNRPISLLNMRGQQQQQIIQKSSKDTSGNVDSLVNPVQGPITLPGGTITVTPLNSLLNAGVQLSGYDGQHGTQTGQHVALSIKRDSSSSGLINVQQQGGGGTAIGNSTAGGKSVKGGISTQQRRNLMASIPPSVSLHLQQLTKTMGDLVKSTMEQITLEVIEHCNNNTQGKAEATRLQVEVERLQSKLKQEVTDVKHNNDIALRELRITMENDRKRAIAEVKRQMEAEKQKAIEETKKKQWCASCGREALFYCCWNTSYCGYPCQEQHWPSHMSSCSQSSGNAR